MDAAFEFFAKLGVPVLLLPRPRHRARGRRRSRSRQRTSTRWSTSPPSTSSAPACELLWGTANLFSNPRYQAGAATNPDPEVFAYAAGQVAHCLEATHRLGGHNYVLWGGREGYETLLNTDMQPRARPAGAVPDDGGRAQAARSGSRARSSSSRSRSSRPSTSTTTTSPPCTPSCSATTSADEIKVNIEVNHATLAGHDFAHEIAAAVNAGIFGSIDANAGDDRLGWDVDRFPVSVEQMTLGMLEILRGGGLHDRRVQLRRRSCAASRSTAPTSSTPTSAGWTRWPARCWRPLRSSNPASSTRFRDARYAGWDGDLGDRDPRAAPRTLADRCTSGAIGAGEPEPRVRPAGAAREPRGPLRRAGALIRAYARGRPRADRSGRRRRARRPPVRSAPGGSPG